MTNVELRAILADLGVRHGAFAKRLGVSRGAVNKWLDGSRGIPEHAVRLARQAAARGYWTRHNRITSKRGADPTDAPYTVVATLDEATRYPWGSYAEKAGQRCGQRGMPHLYYQGRGAYWVFEIDGPTVRYLRETITDRMPK